jgi:PAS domain S-box-containing protein
MSRDIPLPPVPEANAGEFLASAVGIWLWDIARNKLYADSRFAELYGADRRQLALGASTELFFDHIHPDDRMRIRIAVAGVMHGVTHFSRQFRIVPPDGSVRWVSAEGRPEGGKGGKIQRFTGVLSDISDQKHTEERLRIAQSAGGVGTFEYVSGFGTADVSEQFCKLLGLAPTDTVALRAINAVLPAGHPPLIGGPEDVQHEGEMPYRELKIVRPDTGETRWLARRGEVRRDGPAGGMRFIGVIYDITPFKTVESKLLALTETLEGRVAVTTRERDQVWNNSLDLLAVLSADGLFRSVSPSWTVLLGYQPEELIGHRPGEFLVDGDPDVGGLSLTTFENRYRHKDGGERWIAWRTLLEDDLVYAYGRDVTQEREKQEALRQAENQLRQAQKMEAVGQLTGGIAHDFNNMLTGIIGSLDIMRRRIARGQTDQLERFMDSAVASAQRAASLTHRLLAFSRQQTLDPKAVDVAELIVSMEDMLQRTLGETVRLKSSTTAGLWQALSDVNQLENAVLNLAINARDAMPEGGSLTIEAENIHLDAAAAAKQAEVKPGDFVVVSVTDTGEGMPADVLAKAFDPFFTTKPIGQGTGLGLSTVYGFLRQIGGHAEIRSEPRRGTTVRMFLPRFVGEAVAGQEDGDPSARPEGSGETVLVVEDEETVRILIVEVLAELGYRVLQAANGEEAIRHVKAGGPIDLLISDVGLPGLNGRQVAEIARANRPGLRVLFVTGYAAKATVRSSFLEPGMDLIAKPFNMGELAAKISEMLTPAAAGAESQREA